MDDDDEIFGPSGRWSRYPRRSRSSSPFCGVRVLFKGLVWVCSAFAGAGFHTRPSHLLPFHAQIATSSASARAVGAVHGRRSPARHQLNLPLGRAIARHQCSLPQRVQLSGRPAGSCLQLAERRRSCPAQGDGDVLWLEEHGRLEAAAAQVLSQPCQRAARSPFPCVGRVLPIPCSSSRRVLTLR